MAGASLVRESWLGKALLFLAPPVPSPQDDPHVRWSGFAAGCAAWGSLPLYLGIAALVNVAMRSTCRRQRHGSPRLRLLMCVVCALAMVTIAAGVAFAMGLRHISKVQDQAADMAERLRVVEDSSEKLLKITAVARSVAQELMPESKGQAMSRLANIVECMTEAEYVLRSYRDQPSGPRRLLDGSSRWWKQVSQFAMVGVLPFVAVLLSCSAALHIVRLGPRCAWRRALHRLVVLVGVGSSMLVVCGASALCASLDLATAALCDSEDLAMITCLRPHIDKFTFDVCYGYAVKSQGSQIFSGPRKASIMWEKVASSLDDPCMTPKLTMSLPWMLGSARCESQAMEVALDTDAVHAVYRNAIATVCGAMLGDLLAMAACCFLAGAALLPVLAVLAVDALDSAPQEEETELVTTTSALESLPTSWAYPWPRM